MWSLGVWKKEYSLRLKSTKTKNCNNWAISIVSLHLKEKKVRLVSFSAT